MNPVIVLTSSADALPAPVRLFDLRGPDGGPARAEAFAGAVVRSPVGVAALGGTLLVTRMLGKWTAR
jgi:hypothetical protein